jgi:hypothetical protein
MISPAVIVAADCIKVRVPRERSDLTEITAKHIERNPDCGMTQAMRPICDASALAELVNRPQGPASQIVLFPLVGGLRTLVRKS